MGRQRRGRFGLVHDSIRTTRRKYREIPVRRGTCLHSAGFVRAVGASGWFLSSANIGPRLLGTKRLCRKSSATKNKTHCIRMVDPPSLDTCNIELTIFPAMVWAAHVIARYPNGQVSCENFAAAADCILGCSKGKEQSQQACRACCTQCIPLGRGKAEAICEGISPGCVGASADAWIH
jgi:hypothetical protein